MIAFFAGYPFIYAIVYVIAGKKYTTVNSFSKRMVSCLPFAYALTGTLFIGLILKDLYPDYSFKNIRNQFQPIYLVAFAMTSVLFWIPLLSKKTIFSLLHSLVFFSLILKDLFMFMKTTLDREVIQNDMKIYTNSLLLNAVTFVFVLIIHIIIKAIRSKKMSV